MCEQTYMPLHHVDYSQGQNALELHSTYINLVDCKLQCIWSSKEFRSCCGYGESKFIKKMCLEPVNVILFSCKTIA